VRPSRTWQAILDGSRNVRFADFERLLQAFGFVLDRQNGSHRIWLHPGSRARMNVQPQGGDAKPYQVRQLVELVETLGLELRD
jgi:predicted RNA binding protein YcfA (HicA-like mRNA interferase family)